MTTLRHTRYQAAIVRQDALLLLQCAFKNGPTVWILPGGGREEGEADEVCVAREVLEETQLTVRVDRLLFDTPAEPRDGTYTRWRTYLCTVMSGAAAPGGGEGSSADLVDVMWLELHDERRWPHEIQTDVFLYPQLLQIKASLALSPRTEST